MSHVPPNTSEFDGRVALVTGAGSGIGRASAVALARRGARLVLGDASEPGLDGTRGDPALEARLAARVPINRLGTVEEIAAAVVYLCSDASAFVIGHTMVLDGGVTAA